MNQRVNGRVTRVLHAPFTRKRFASINGGDQRGCAACAATQGVAGRIPLVASGHIASLTKGCLAVVCFGAVRHFFLYLPNERGKRKMCRAPRKIVRKCLMLQPIAGVQPCCLRVNHKRGCCGQWTEPCSNYNLGGSDPTKCLGGCKPKKWGRSRPILTFPACNFRLGPIWYVSPSLGFRALRG